LDDRQKDVIASAATELDDLRSRWLNLLAALLALNLERGG
jgi:hypothetical protein